MALRRQQRCARTSTRAGGTVRGGESGTLCGRDGEDRTRCSGKDGTRVRTEYPSIEHVSPVRPEHDQVRVLLQRGFEDPPVRGSFGDEGANRDGGPVASRRERFEPPAGSSFG